MRARTIILVSLLIAASGALHAPASAQSGVKRYEIQEIQRREQLRRQKEAYERSEIQRQQNLRKQRAAYQVQEQAKQRALEAKTKQYDPFAMRAAHFIRSAMRICNGKLQIFNDSLIEITNTRTKMSSNDYNVQYRINMNYFAQPSDVEKLNNGISEIAVLSFIVVINDAKNLYVRSIKQDGRPRWQRCNDGQNCPDLLQWTEWGNMYNNEPNLGHTDNLMVHEIGHLVFNKKNDKIILSEGLRMREPFQPSSLNDIKLIDEVATLQSKYFRSFTMEGFFDANGHRFSDVNQMNCVDDDLNIFPMFEATKAALAKLKSTITEATPLRNPANWISTEDYPPEASNKGITGRVGYEVVVSTEGRVEKCTIVQSSGSPLLDEATCQLVSRRARFNPAYDGTGTFVLGSYSNAVRWGFLE